MGAFRVLLTHFSQRYPYAPDYGDGPSCMVAFDGLSFPLTALPLLPRAMPVLRRALDPRRSQHRQAGFTAKRPRPPPPMATPAAPVATHVFFGDDD